MEFYSLTADLVVGDTFDAITVEGVDVTYSVTSLSPKTVKVGKGKGYASIYYNTTGPVTIPSTVKGFTVTCVADGAFNARRNLTVITLPPTITSLETYAFSLVDVETVCFSEGITEFPIGLFNGSLIRHLTIPASVQSILKNAFTSCSELKSVRVLSASPYPIKSTAFPTRGNITLFVPKGSKEAYQNYSYWGEFKEIVELDDDMTDILLPGATFTSPTVEGVDMKFCITSLFPNTVQVAANAVSTETTGHVTIPSSVEGYEVIGIAGEAFKGSNIKSITIPASIQTINGSAFNNCNNLEYVFMDAETPIAIPADAFPNRANTTLYVPKGSKEAYAAADYWNEFREIFVTPEDMTGLALPGTTFTSKTVEGIEVTYSVHSLEPLTAKIASDAVNNSARGSVTIPANAEGYEVVGVAKNAFKSASNLTEITIPATVTSLDERAFYLCDAKEVHLPEGLQVIPNEAFYFADITSLTIPASVQSIGNKAFYWCNRLNNISIPESVQSIGSNAFERCPSLNLILMKSTTPIAIPEDAFPTRANITLYVPKGSKETYEAADYWKEFKEVVELQSDDMTGILLPGSTFTSSTIEGIDVTYTVQSLLPLTVKVASDAVSRDVTGPLTIPSNVEGYEVIGVAAQAFEHVSGLTEITLPATITSLDNYAFWYSYAKEVHLPEGLTAIPLGAFYKAQNTRITIPASVQSIGSDAFYQCSNLNYVFMDAATPIAIPENAFPTRTNVILYVPYGSKEAYEAADYWKEFKEINELLEDMTGILLPGSTFTSPTVEGIDVTYTVQSLSPLTVKVASDAVSKEATGSITIPSTAEGYEVIGVSREAFGLVDNLTEITLPATITTLDYRAFYQCKAKEIHLPEGLISISSDAFKSSDIPYIIIPASVQTIGEEAFMDCNNMTYVLVEGTTPATLAETSFPDRANLMLYVPKGSKEAYLAADYWKDFKQIVELQEGDANGDDKVNITDAVSIVDYILGNPATTFIRRSADVNNDGQVNITDAVGVVDIILNADK